MMKFRLTLLILLVPLLGAPAQAGIIFGRKKPDKPDPRQRVPDLVNILKTDRDADKRSAAASELRYYDPSVFPEIVPALIGALQTDSRTGVRIDAAHSLSKLRPVSPIVGDALEQAVAKDSSMRVRLQARSALLQYHWAGYRGKKTGVPPLSQTREPPMVGEQTPPAISTTRPAPGQVPGGIIEIPLAPSTPSQPRIRPVPVVPPTIRPKPKGKQPLEDLPKAPKPKIDRSTPKGKGPLENLPRAPMPKSGKPGTTPKPPSVEKGPELP